MRRQPSPLSRSGLRRSIFGVFICTHLIALSASAIPPRSLTTKTRGFVQVGETVPWISGWDLEGQAYNLKSLLRTKREAKSSKSVYVLLCHTQVRECSASVRFLHNLRGRFESEGIDVVIVFTEEIEPEKLKSWLALRNVTLQESFQVLIDRYHRSALRLGAYQAQRVDLAPESHTRSPKSNVTSRSLGGEGKAVQARSSQPSAGSQPQGSHASESQRRASRTKSTATRGSTKQAKALKLKHELRVPLGVLMNTEGRALMIVIQEGADLSDKITQTLRYQGI